MKRWLILLVIISFPRLLALASPLPRGILMLDVSRHFMPMSFLYRRIVCTPSTYCLRSIDVLSEPHRRIVV